MATPKRTLDGRKRERRAALRVYGELAARQLGAAALVWARHAHALALQSQMAEQLSAPTHPSAARLGQLAARVHVGDEALGEPIGLQR